MFTRAALHVQGCTHIQRPVIDILEGVLMGEDGKKGEKPWNWALREPGVDQGPRSKQRLPAQLRPQRRVPPEGL